MEIIGNKKIARFLRSLAEAGNLSHAYCVCGPEGIGKRALVLDISSRVLNCEISRLGLNPDFYFVSREIEEKTGKKKKDILNEESGNALLKMIEEPPEKSIVFLLVENDDILLPTIRSRCQILRMSTAPDEEIKNYLSQKGASAELSAQICALAQGRTGRAVKMFENFEELEMFVREKNRFEDILSLPVYKRWKKVGDLFSEKIGIVQTQENLGFALDIWIASMREKMREGIFAKKSAQIAIDAMNEAKKILSQNVNPKLIIENLLIQF
jgi:DNA polymerase-3 subunit delta'